MLGYFLQYFTVSIRFHVIGRHRPFGSANSNKNVPTYMYIMLWHAGIHTHFVVLMEPQSSENCAFSYSQVAISTTKYMNIPIPR